MSENILGIKFTKPLSQNICILENHGLYTQSHKWPITGLCINNDNKYIITSSTDHLIKVWSYQTTSNCHH